MKICIDPGHGGSDPGAVGNGLKEKDITLDISSEVARILKGLGLTVIMTRDTDRFIDLTPERTPPCDISVSIHVNSGGGEGLETWVSLFHQVLESEKLGQAIQDSILKQVPFKDRRLKSKKNTAGSNDYLYMLRKPHGVAVLVECGFIDNAGDAGILRQDVNRKKIAAGIAAGIAQYLGIEQKGEDNVLAKLKLDAEVNLPDVKVVLEGKNIDKTVILNVDGKDTTYIPAIALREIGMTVNWDAATQTVVISKGEK